MLNTSDSDTSDYIFRLSEIIVQEFLQIGDNDPNHFFRERGREIWEKLEAAYRDEGCCKEDNHQECEKQFVLRSLPYISGVIQVNSTIRHFNEAIEQVEKIYALENQLFEQAMNLSYLVFAYAIDKGHVVFSTDNTQFYYKTGINKDFEKKATRFELWEEMRSQVGKLLKKPLTPQLPKGRPGKPWYSLAQRYAIEVKNKRDDIEKMLKEKPNEITKAKAEIENDIKIAIENLNEAIEYDNRCKDEANNDPVFDTIRDDPGFKDLIG
jgi:hypothetical protein